MRWPKTTVGPVCHWLPRLFPGVGTCFSPTTKDDTMEVVTKCNDYQFFSKQIMKHANPLWLIDLSWSFAIWGIDIMGILPKAPGGFRILFVAINTFTK
jgi:hypothetical protein